MLRISLPLSGAVKRLQVRGLASLSSSPAVLPRRTGGAQQPPSAGAASQWSIEDPDTRYRERRGHTVEVLRDSYPNFFSDLPNLEIYTPDSLPLPIEPPLRQTDPSSHRPLLRLPCLTSSAVQFVHSGVPEGCLRGIRAYRQLFDALRLTRNTAVADADLSYHLSLPSAETIRVRWHARLWLRMPLPSLGSFVGVHDGAAPLLVDGVSLYELDGDARIAACWSCRSSLAWPRAAPRYALGGKPFGRSEPGGRLRCGREVRPKSPIMRHPLARPLRKCYYTTVLHYGGAAYYPGVSVHRLEYVERTWRPEHSPALAME